MRPARPARLCKDGDLVTPAPWRALGTKELLACPLVGLLYSLIELSHLVYIGEQPLWPLALARHLLEPQLVILGLLLLWLPVARSNAQGPARLWRLAAATLLGALLGLLLVRGLQQLTGWPSVDQLMWLQQGKIHRPPPAWAELLSAGLSALIPCGLIVALVEMRQRQARSWRQLQEVLLQQSAMARQALATRLAALQAQVEPELLFDTLVEIEQAYERAEPQAALQMERLIRHLRVALPRLRENGSRLEGEAELLDSYLAVMAGRRGRTIHFSSDWPAALNGRTLPPMLLLPLLQRALRLAWQAQQRLPGRCQLQASALGPDGQGLRLALSLDLAGLCGDDPSLQALAERLRASSGGPARLHCRSDAGHTVFTLELEP